MQRVRYLRGLTQTELALAVGLDRTGISCVEAGRRRLAATELVRFAEAPGVTVPGLLTPLPPRSQSPNPARALLKAGPATANDEPQLAWFVALVEHAALTGSWPTLPHVNRRASALPPGPASELGARSARRYAGLDLLAPDTSISGLLYHHDIFVASARLPCASRDAGCAVTVASGRAAVLVNASRSATRQRSTAAHELPHPVFDVETSASACAAVEIRSGPRSRAEQRAAANAAALLLPKRAVAPLRGPPLDLERLPAIKVTSGVSHVAMVHRLQGLGVLAGDEARVLRKLAGHRTPPRTITPFRVDGESLARLVANEGARRAGIAHGYDEMPDGDVIA